MVNRKCVAQMAQWEFTQGKKPKSLHGILQKEKWSYGLSVRKSQFQLGGDKRKSCTIKKKAWKAH